MTTEYPIPQRIEVRPRIAGGERQFLELDLGLVIVADDDGTWRFRHPCRDGHDPAPLLSGHRVPDDWADGDPISLWPSVLCVDCGTHGWVRDGYWEAK